MFVPLASAGTGELLLENEQLRYPLYRGDDGLAAELVRDSLQIRERVIADIGVDFTEKDGDPSLADHRGLPGGPASRPDVDSPLGRGGRLSRTERHRPAFAAGNQGEPDRRRRRLCPRVQPHRPSGEPSRG